MSKKTFNDELKNPALTFINTTAPEPKEEEQAKDTPKEPAPAGYYTNPIYIEKKSRRLQLLIKPSIYEKLKRKATETGSSINDLVNIILEDNLKGV